MDLAIAVVAYNRPDSLRRLLGSISKASINAATLYISVDGFGDPLTIQLAEQFFWPNGEKKLVLHTSNLGLRDHILTCTDLVNNHEGIIILEDDLLVAPSFHEYAQKALSFYGGDDRLSGVSLYSHGFNETAEMPFIPLNDGSGVFFMQMASSWGQCFTREQWSRFRMWHANNQRLSRKQINRLPPNVARWPESSWKKLFVCHMVESDSYFVYPRESQCTNFADKGVNLNNDDHFQVPLSHGKYRTNFRRFSESNLKYDSFCEMLPECLNLLAGNLSEQPFSVDLYGNKPIEQITTEYILTSRKSTRPIQSFAMKMLPHEANVVENIQGGDIVFSHLSHVDKARLGFTTSRIVYYHRLPAWHRKMRRSQLENPEPLSENEERLLRTYNRWMGKLILKPIIFSQRLFLAIKKLI